MPPSDSAATESALLAEVLAAARRIAVFTGAGISTESGIPDFRGPSGLWNTAKPVTFQDFIASEEARIESWERNVRLHDMLARSTPNRGHRAVAALVANGRAEAAITQNIDGLHQAAGIADDRVIEIHGTCRKASCLDCGKPFGLPDTLARFAATRSAPRCDDCGGLIKTATISFGQTMPALPMQQAQAAIDAADLVLVLGSSLRVYPAASLPEQAARQGKRLVILNAEATPLDRMASLVLRRGIGQLLGDALNIGA